MMERDCYPFVALPAKNLAYAHQDTADATHEHAELLDPD